MYRQGESTVNGSATIEPFGAGLGCESYCA